MKAEVRIVDLINGGEAEAVFFGEYCVPDGRGIEASPAVPDECGNFKVLLLPIIDLPCPQDGYRAFLTCWNHFGESSTASVDIVREDCTCDDPDAGPPDAGPPDAAQPDAGPPEAGPPDAGPPDAGPPDAAPPDAGPPEAGP